MFKVALQEMKRVFPASFLSIVMEDMHEITFDSVLSDLANDKHCNFLDN